MPPLRADLLLPGLTRTRRAFWPAESAEELAPISQGAHDRTLPGPLLPRMCWVLWRRRVDRALGSHTRSAPPGEGSIGQVLTALGPGWAAIPSVSPGPGPRESRAWTQAPAGTSLKSGHYLLGGSVRAPLSWLGVPEGLGEAGAGENVLLLTRHRCTVRGPCSRAVWSFA